MRWQCIPSLTDAPDGSEDSDKYGSYQGLLQNYITFSTLLMGFIVTGTLLSIALSGQDNFTALELVEFLKYSGIAAISAGVTMIISFLVSIWGHTAFTNKDAKHGLLEMRRSTLWIGGAELCIFFSLTMFWLSTFKYAELSYLGPDICPRSYNATSGLATQRTASFCTKTAAGLWKEAFAVCNKSYQSDYNEVCELVDRTLNYLGTDDADYDADDYDTKVPARFAWDADDDDFEAYPYGSANYLKAIDVLTSMYCSKNLAANIKTAQCKAGMTADSCLLAVKAYQAADGCSGDKTEDCIKCYKVCHTASRSHEIDTRPDVSLNYTIWYAGNAIIVVLGILFAVRAISAIRMFVAVLQMDTQGSLRQELCECTEDTSSDSDRDATTSPRGATRELTMQQVDGEHES